MADVVDVTVLAVGGSQARVDGVESLDIHVSEGPKHSIVPGLFTEQF